MLGKVGGAFLFQCNYDLKFLDLKNLSAFHKNVFALWQELNSKDPLNANEFKQENIWNNRFIRINGKTIYYKTWVNKDISRISDLLIPMAISFHSKFLNANSAFAVLSLIMLVFLQQFQKLGRAKS